MHEFSYFNQIYVGLFDVCTHLSKHIFDLSCLYCLTHFALMLKSNTIIKRA